MSSVLDSVAPEMRGRVKFVKVDSEKYASIASQYAVGGEERQQQHGGLHAAVGTLL